MEYSSFKPIKCRHQDQVHYPPEMEEWEALCVSDSYPVSNVKAGATPRLVSPTTKNCYEITVHRNVLEISSKVLQSSDFLVIVFFRCCLLGFQAILAKKNC